MDNENISKKELYDLAKTTKQKEEESQKKKNMLKTTAIWASVITVVGASVWGLILLSGRGDTNTPVIITTALSENDVTKGSKDSKNILIEYSDFQCPACKAYQPLVKRLLAEQGDKFLFVYRHFPLAQHGNAKVAAYAAEAAHNQGKFWEMHDMIFEGQESWAEKRNAEEIFGQYAKSLGLDMAKFEEDSKSDAVYDKVDAQYKSGIKNQVNSTPTFFLNGTKIQPRSYEEFVQLVTAGQ